MSRKWDGAGFVSLRRYASALRCVGILEFHSPRTYSADQRAYTGMCQACILKLLAIEVPRSNKLVSSIERSLTGIAEGCQDVQKLGIVE